MKLIHTLTIASAAFGLAATSMAGTSTAAPAACSPDAFNQWNVELSLLHQRARGNDYTEQHFEDGYRLGVSYQPCPESLGYRVTYTEFKGTEDTSGIFEDHGPDITKIDFEAFKTGLQLGPVNCSYSFGLRYLDIVEDSLDFVFIREVDYRGFGPVVGFDASYALPYNFSLYGEASAAYLFGHDKQGNASDDEYTFSFGAGLRYDITFCPMIEGAYVKAGYEVEHLNQLTNANSAKVQGWVFSLGYDF
ncbi:MAG TPA: Lpg1974 family pore-forming outer membrane protein [Luteolibacter sp.]|nr:Lpg1974 family pore-forming outer membrane protein [Luteolibacter sp.]